MPGNLKSQAQFRLFARVCKSGRAKKAKGLSRSAACESIAGVKPKTLPERKKAK